MALSTARLLEDQVAMCSPRGAWVMRLVRLPSILRQVGLWARRRMRGCCGVRPVAPLDERVRNGSCRETGGYPLGARTRGCSRGLTPAQLAGGFAAYWWVPMSE